MTVKLVEGERGRASKMGVALEDGAASEAALEELRTRLECGLVEQRATKTALARRAGLGRTAVSEAFNRAASVPSARIVGALGQALQLNVPELLTLRNVAAGTQRAALERGSAVPSAGIGIPISHCDPHDLEVHPAIDVDLVGGSDSTVRRRRLPQYVRRRHDQGLDDVVEAAVSGRSGMAVLVGESSTGKTRACWEAIQPLASLGWELWHPLGPTRAEALLKDLQHVEPRTVVWLNEAQHYFGSSRETAERIAASFRALLANRRLGPVLVLGTLWNEYATTYTALPVAARKDPYPQVRELLAGRLIMVPERFNAIALQDAQSLADRGDLQLSHALRCQKAGRITQYLAGAPALLDQYKMASPPVRALIQCVMDARRFGIDSNVPAYFLARAVEDYLTDGEYAALGEGWLTESLREAGKSVHGNLALLTSTRLRKESLPEGEGARGSVRLADSLEQFGRVDRSPYCPPQSFWAAACEFLESPDTLVKLAEAALDRHRIYWARRLSDRVVELEGDASSLSELASVWADIDPVRAEFLFLESAKLGSGSSMGSMGYRCEEKGDLEDAKEWYHRGAEFSDGFSSCELGRIYFESGDLELSERFYRRALELGDTESLGGLARVLIDRGGDLDEALSLLQRAICTTVRQSARISMLGMERDADLNRLGVAPWFSRGQSTGWVQQIEEMGDAGDCGRFLEVVTAAAKEGDSYGLRCLYYLLGSSEGDAAEKLLESAALKGESFAVIQLGRRLGERGDLRRAEFLYRKSLSSGREYSLVPLADLMQRVQKFEEAESLYWRAIDAGLFYAARQLSELKEGRGDREGAERVALLAADAGHSAAVHSLSKLRIQRGKVEGLWPHGLNPDGTPASGM
ncbi:hypothetical protein AB0891_03070 [Streptomyces sp. NPDC007259]|uniref:hypothetical protein n=1 Tax=Streptomyces sp. NPDC007259 TaxID=3154319 RepID=UPI003454E5E8